MFFLFTTLKFVLVQPISSTVMSYKYQYSNKHLTHNNSFNPHTTLSRYLHFTNESSWAQKEWLSLTQGKTASKLGSWELNPRSVDPVYSLHHDYIYCSDAVACAKLPINLCPEHQYQYLHFFLSLGHNVPVGHVIDIFQRALHTTKVWNVLAVTDLTSHAEKFIWVHK